MLAGANHDRTTGKASPRFARRGQSLVEFAVVALVLYMLLAAILTFGHLIYVAQGLQSAADLGAREISRTPFKAINPSTGDALTFSELVDPNSGLTDTVLFRERIFDEAWLVIDLQAFYANNSEGDVFQDLVPKMPVLNQQLTTLMIVDRPDFDGDGQADAWLMRYPGALLSRPQPILSPNGGDYSQFGGAVATEYAVGIPLVTSRDASGTETIRWIPVVQEIKPSSGGSPFAVDSPHGGIVALRLNYPFQSASMSSFRINDDGPFEPTLGQPNLANDDEVDEINSDDRPGGLTDEPLVGAEIYAGTYGGRYGLGAQGALGQTVRPYRRVLSAQAIYRREVFE